MSGTKIHHANFPAAIGHSSAWSDWLDRHGDYTVKTAQAIERMLSAHNTQGRVYHEDPEDCDDTCHCFPDPYAETFCVECGEPTMEGWDLCQDCEDEGDEYEDGTEDA